MNAHTYTRLPMAACLWLLLLPSWAQEVPGIIAGAEERTFQSLNPKKDASVQKTQINRIDTRAIFFNSLDGTKASRKGGIVADNFGAGGRVTLSVYLYDETRADGKGDKIYSCYSTRNSISNDDYVEMGDPIVVSDPLSPNAAVVKSVSETNIAARLQAIHAAPDQQCDRLIPGKRSWSMAWSAAGLTAASNCTIAAALSVTTGPLTPLVIAPACGIGALFGGVGGFFASFFGSESKAVHEKYYCAERYLPSQPIIAELTVKNATVRRVKIPGVAVDRNTALAKILFGDMSGFQVTISVNNVQQATLHYPQATGSEPTVNMKLGDEVGFEIIGDQKIQPRITGVPDVWIARFAGEAFYYCSPSVTPGEYKPFLGFDSQVHGTAIRKYPEEWKSRDGTYYNLKVNPMEYATMNYGKTVSSWSWTMSREMDATKTAYTPAFTWNKNKTSPIQRNNQREGLNMELLQTFADWGVNEVSSFSNMENIKKQYIYGFDPDEILYLNRKNPNTKIYDPSSQEEPPKLVRVTEEPWKKTPEGNQSSLNMMVTAYRKNRMAVLDGLACTKIYDGYEIQDIGTNSTAPNGNGTGNVKAPGLVTINLFNDYAVKVKFNVTSPLPDANKGFYNQIKGTQWPSIKEGHVPYSIKLPPNLAGTELSRYSLRYDYEDNLGILKSVKVVAGPENYNSTTGNFTARFDMGVWGYHTVTAYYQRCDACKAVPVAGKELMDIGLRFINLSTANYTDKKDGAFIYLEEYRDKKLEGESYLKKFGKLGDKGYREYAFKQNQEVSVEITDSDPHTFPVSDKEWYLSERAQAKRIPNDSLNTYLVTTISPMNSSSLGAPIIRRTGRKFNFSSDQVGIYELKSSYRDSSNVYHPMAIENYQTIRDVGSLQAKLVTEYGEKLRGSVANRIRLIGLMHALPEGESTDDYSIYQLRFTYSDFMFKTGPRANTAPHVNRFGRYNDYYNAVNWEFTNTSNNTLIDLSNYQGNLSIFLNNYGTTEGPDDLNDLYKWYPDIWLRHYSDNAPSYPKDMAVNADGTLKYMVPDNEVDFEIGGLFLGSSMPEPWQVRIPWVSWTDTEGPRIRTNIKVITEVYKFFNNNTGAFSGNPAVPAEKVFRDQTLLKLMTDDQKDLKQAYYDFKFGRKILLNMKKLKQDVPAGSSAINVRAYSRNLDGTNGALLHAFYISITSGDGREAAPEATIATEADHEEGMDVFPNPAAKKLSVKFAEDVSNVEFQVIDATGTVCGYYSNGHFAEHNGLQIDNLPDGVYILRGVTNKAIYVRKFVVQK